MNKLERINIFKKINSELLIFENKEIENGIMHYCLTANNCTSLCSSFSPSIDVERVLSKHSFPTDLESVVEFFEAMLEQDSKDANGIVFTPKYIAEYIVGTTLNDVNNWSKNISIIDPCCGSGIFLIAAVEYIHKKFDIPVDDIICHNIYGLEIESSNIHHCKLILVLLSAYYGGKLTLADLPNHFICCDSLKENWSDMLGINSFKYIIGNPPYVNPHDLNKATVNFLKHTFVTTKTGVFNIFYAFIEYAYRFLSEDGILSYIIPNNFLTIKSATDLREFLQRKKCVRSILDFGTNMVFHPIRTYNCIISIDKNENEKMKYCVMGKSEDIQHSLSNLEFDELYVTSLNSNGWKLVDRTTKKNLDAIEGQSTAIKPFIRTGIATLRDNVYLVDRDDAGYYKLVDGIRFDIETNLVKTIYKIPELKTHENIDDAARSIIFPYIVDKSGYKLIPECELQSTYPMAYQYLLHQKVVLDERDKGKGIAQGWYAYGRTQGLNKFGRKLLFPTFSGHPRFLYVNDENSLFCNGYAVFENDILDLDILAKILNSNIMDYYIRNTSYAIEGDYYCYQKKYIERFTIPILSDSEIAFIRDATPEQMNSFLCQKYGIAI